MTCSPGSVAAAVRKAAKRLEGRVERTPLVRSAWLSEAIGSEVRLKLENLQRTGSFKVRGAFHALLALPPDTLARGVVAASSGNHGLGLATAARALGAEALVFVPTTAPEGRVRRIREAGAEVRRVGDDCVRAEREARAFADAEGRHYVSPYNDPQVVAGQGTIAVELLEQWPEVERIYVALGGGGLVGGIASHARAVRPGIRIVACSPAASPAMETCVREGRIVEVTCRETLSDSTAGGVEPGAITFPLCRDLVDEFVSFDEGEIASAILASLRFEHLLIEGAAALAVAACLREGRRDPRRTAVVVCGGNLSLETLAGLLGRPAQPSA